MGVRYPRPQPVPDGFAEESIDADDQCQHQQCAKQQRDRPGQAQRPLVGDADHHRQKQKHRGKIE